MRGRQEQVIDATKKKNINKPQPVVMKARKSREPQPPR